MTDPERRAVAPLERAIGRVLRLGTVMSSICLAAGLLLTIAGTGGSLAGVLLAAGLLILIATPAARVIVSVVGYAREGDWLFVALTLTVLLALAGSVVAAFWNG